MPEWEKNAGKLGKNEKQSFDKFPVNCYGYTYKTTEMKVSVNFSFICFQ